MWLQQKSLNQESKNKVQNLSNLNQKQETHKINSVKMTSNKVDELNEKIERKL